MKTAFLVGGPLIVAIGFGFYSGLLEFAHNIDGLEHKAGVPMGGTFVMEYEEVYQCDENGDNCVLVEENTELREAEEGDLPAGVSASPNYRLEEQQTGFSDVSGLEIEEQPIEYREGVGSEYNKTKQPGIAKYANIVMRRPSGFDWKTLRFEFQRQAEVETINKEYDQKIKDSQEEGEMIQIDPPKLVIPVN